MTNPQTDLQKELFLESMSLIHAPGWEVLKEDDLIAFKAPVSQFMDFVYGNVTLNRYNKVKAFYQEKPFLWMLSENQEEQLLLDWGFIGPDLTYEMGLNLADYHYHGAHEPIEVREVSSSSKDYLQWINVAAGWLNIDPVLVDQFFTLWIKTGKYIPYLGFYEGQPAATSLAYLGNLGASLYCLGTLPAFRNLGLGTAVTHACLKAAKDKNIAQAVLYGSKMGQPMYKKIGFKLMQTIREYSCAHP